MAAVGCQGRLGQIPQNAAEKHHHPGRTQTQDLAQGAPEDHHRHGIPEDVHRIGVQPQRRHCPPPLAGTQALGVQSADLEEPMRRGHRAAVEVDIEHRRGHHQAAEDVGGTQRRQGRPDAAAARPVAVGALVVDQLGAGSLGRPAGDHDDVRLARRVDLDAVRNPRRRERRHIRQKPLRRRRYQAFFNRAVNRPGVKPAAHPASPAAATFILASESLANRDAPCIL